MEKIEFGGWTNCIRLSNGTIELIITTDIGPRIIRCGFINKKNLFYVSEEDKGKTGGSAWRIYGGHRLWHAPEVMPRSYFPDNNRVDYSWNGKTLFLRQETESTTGILKEIEITLDPHNNHISVMHRLINKNLWAIEAAPWAITAHAAGGTAILPQEPYIDPAACLLPARPIVLWHYTQMKDPRWLWGNRYIRIKQDSTLKTEQKIGTLNKQEWMAYNIDKYLMIKYFDYDPHAHYTDYGCNNEVYVNEHLLETETLGPMHKIQPEHATEHTEHWLLHELDDPLETRSESVLDKVLQPVVKTFDH